MLLIKVCLLFINIYNFPSLLLFFISSTFGEISFKNYSGREFIALARMEVVSESQLLADLKKMRSNIPCIALDIDETLSWTGHRFSVRCVCVCVCLSVCLCERHLFNFF